MENKTKVLFVTLRTDVGGGPKCVEILIKFLPDEFDIFVACPSDPPYYDIYKANKRVKGFYNLPHRKFTIGKYLGLIKYVSKNKIDVVCSNGRGAGLYARLLKLFCLSVKIVHTFNGVNIKDIGSLKSRIYFLSEKFLSLFTDKFINVSFGEQSVCVEHGIFKKERSVVIHNGIEPLKRNNTFSVEQLKGKFVVVSLSRFDFQKNMLDSYKIALTLKGNPDIVFLWIGDGDDKKELEKLAVENQVNILFTGFKNNIADYLSISDLCLSTARWEGLPLALLEASSLGVPVIATDIIGNNEVVKNGVTGFLFQSGDTEDAVSKILKLYNDKDLRKQFSEASSHDFFKNFSGQTMADKTALLLKEVLT